jgi:hypothetical protein
MADAKTALSRIDALDAPAEIRAAIKRLSEDLWREGATNLKGLILYGGLARDRYRPGKSDINLVVLLGDASSEAITPLAPVLRSAWRAVRVEPFIITPVEVARLADTFPTKLMDIKDHHIVLLGEDPFAEINVSRKDVLLRIEQSLTNIAIRLRRRYVSIFDDPRSIAQTMAETAASLKVELSAMLRMAGKPEPAEPTSMAVLKSAATVFDLDAEALHKAAALRRDENLPDNLHALYNRVLQSVTRAAEIVADME